MNFVFGTVIDNSVGKQVILWQGFPSVDILDWMIPCRGLEWEIVLSCAL